MITNYMRSFSVRIVIPLLLTALTLFAAKAPKSTSSYALTVTPDRPECLYKQGDTVTFNVRLTHDKKPVETAEVQWQITKDGLAPTNTGTVTLSGGAGTITGKLNEPGFLLCRASCKTPEKTTLTALGGAGIDPLQIKPSLPVPTDFDSFWEAQKKKLVAVPLKFQMTPVKSGVDGVEAFDVQADCVGAPVSGYFARPLNAKTKSLPIILLVHGAGVRSSSLGSATGWAKQGFLAMDMNAHGIPNGKPAEYYTNLTNGELKDYRARGRESRDTVYFQGMFLRLIRGNDFLTAQPEWDGRTLIVHGSSQGGAQSIVAAGLDPRVSFFAAGVPAMCDHTGLMVNRINGWPKFLPAGEEGKAQKNVIEAVRYYDAMNFATRIKAPGIITVGFIDTTCPPSSVYAAYNALPGKKEIFNDPPSPHAVTPPAGAAMKGAIQKHVEEMRKK